MPRILVVEDEQALLDTVQRFFTREGFDVHTARSRSEALDLYNRYPPDVVVLDVMLNEGPEPDFDGFDVCKALRDAEYEGPVIFVTARTSEADKLTGFDLGADDYVTKPFSLREVMARVKARLRNRTVQEEEAGVIPDEFHFGNVDVDLRRRILRKNGEEHRLTTHEAGVLGYLIGHRGRDVSREELLQEVWGYSPNMTTRTVDNQILKLRKKVEDVPADPRHILTVHGTGYRFEP